MAAKKITVDLYYDVISPYAWIGFELLCRYRNEWNSMALRLKPFFTSAILKMSQNPPPVLNEKKFNYFNKDVIRLNKYYGIPMQFPSYFLTFAKEQNSLNAQRFITAIDMITDGKDTEELSRQLWKRTFTFGKDVTRDESFRDAAKDAKIDEKIIENAIIAMKTNDVKDKLKQITNEAYEYGAFGTPTIVVHLPSGPEMVFGSDRMDIVGSLIGEKYIGPLKKYSKI